MFGKLTKIKAGALQYVLIISVIIAILLLAFMLLINLQKQTATKQDFYKQTIFNVMNGFEYLSNSEITYDETTSQQFSENTKENTQLLKKKWGLFDVGVVTSTIGKQTFEKIALLGGKQEERDALYLQDNNTPLVLVGNTKIVGNVRLPRQGVKPGNIAGTSFYGNTLIAGNQHTSTSQLPSIPNFEQIETIVSYFYSNDSIQPIVLEEHTKRVQSFKKKTLLYESPGTIKLRNISLKGNILIRSFSKIIVKSTTNLEDVLLIAPAIEIQEHTEGNFQAFASKTIEVGKASKLKYPSALVLIGKTNKQTPENRILLAEQVQYKGILCYKEKEQLEERSYQPQIIVKNDTEVVGEIYCEGNLEMLGTVKGTVVTKEFLTNQNGSTYINHIYHGVINEKELPAAYVGLKQESNQQGIAKWLY